MGFPELRKQCPLNHRWPLCPKRWRRWRPEKMAESCPWNCLGHTREEIERHYERFVEHLKRQGIGEILIGGQDVIYRCSWREKPLDACPDSPVLAKWLEYEELTLDDGDPLHSSRAQGIAGDPGEQAFRFATAR